MPDEANTQTAVEAEPAEVLSREIGDWRLTPARDAMTDETGVAATASFNDGQYVTSIALRCLAGKRFGYAMEFADVDAKPALVDWRGPYSPILQVRLGNSETIAARIASLRHANFIILEDNDILKTMNVAGRIGETYWKRSSDFDVMRMALAPELRLKIKLTGGDTIVRINQSDPNVKRVLDECGVGRERLTEGAIEAEEQQKRDAQAYDQKLREGDKHIAAEPTPDAVPPSSSEE